jgi:predicted DNA-binding transcriptional regulator YafY
VRADRLVATLLLLQSRGRVTAAEVAEELEVSERTARRDLEALSMAGIPVYSQAGRGGGWSLLGGARTDLSGLTAAEARTLFLVAGPQSAATPEAKSALRKLVQALPETFRADAEAAASAVMLDPASWGAQAQAPPRFLDDLQRAVVDGVQVELGYSDRERKESQRTVSPLGLVQKDRTWYLVANTAKGVRTFRVGRVRSVERTEVPAVRPEGFDLAETWAGVVATMDEKRTANGVRVLVAEGLVTPLRWHFGTDLVVDDPPVVRPDGRVEVTIGGPSWQRVVPQLAGYGDGVEVVAPEEARAELAEIGARLVARYT